MATLTPNTPASSPADQQVVLLLAAILEELRKIQAGVDLLVEQLA